VKHAETIPVEVARIEQVTPLIREFTLQPVGAGELPPFSGGCHIVVVMRAGNRIFRNPYSLMGSPRDLSSYHIAVRRHDQGRGGSLFMHCEVQVGTRLEITHPVNLFPLAKLARKHIFIARGIGITPMMAMIDDIREGPVPWELHYALGGPGHDYFELALRALGRDRIHLYYDSAGEVPDFRRILADKPLGTHVYTCGPGSMIEAVGQAARGAGWAGSHIHSEQFAAPPVGEPFDVYLARSGLTVHVPAERSLLEAIEAAGVDAPYLCRGGACGQCETDILELDGELIHNDHWLSEAGKASGRKIMPCVSRARCTRLVLDR
jgi:ferredoxin-NADP reductase